MHSVIATAREESVYLPVMARVLKVEQMTELEKLFTVQLPGARSLGNDLVPGGVADEDIEGHNAFSRIADQPRSAGLGQRWTCYSLRFRRAFHVRRRRRSCLARRVATA